MACRAAASWASDLTLCPAEAGDQRGGLCLTDGTFEGGGTRDAKGGEDFSDVFWNQTDQSDCDPVHCKVKEPENRKEKSKCFEIEIDGYKVTNTVNYLSESRRQKRGEKVCDGRPKGFLPLRRQQ